MDMFGANTTGTDFRIGLRAALRPRCPRLRVGTLSRPDTSCRRRIDRALRRTTRTRTRTTKCRLLRSHAAARRRCCSRKSRLCTLHSGCHGRSTGSDRRQRPAAAAGGIGIRQRRLRHSCPGTCLTGSTPFGSRHTWSMASLLRSWEWRRFPPRRRASRRRTTRCTPR
jgi:hypothetical protein